MKVNELTRCYAQTGSLDGSVGKIRRGSYGKFGRGKDQTICQSARDTGAATGERTWQVKSREFLNCSKDALRDDLRPDLPDTFWNYSATPL